VWFSSTGPRIKKERKEGAVNIDVRNFIVDVCSQWLQGGIWANRAEEGCAQDADLFDGRTKSWPKKKRELIA